MLKKYITILLFLFTGIAIHAQRNYLSFDYSISQFKASRVGNTMPALSEKLNRFEGNYTGAAYHISMGRKNSLALGIGLSKIIYQKEWTGIFPETNQFGIATVNGKIAYWSFPVSYTRMIGYGRGLSRDYRYGKDRFHFGFSITYTPSFEGKNSFSASTSGGAGLADFLSTFRCNEQSFQHSLTIGLCDQIFLINKGLRVDLEPYAGIGSGYFKESGTNINTISFGLRFRICISAKLPTIRIEKEVDPGNAAEKKKQLEQKQKEIQEQLNKNQTKKP